MTMTESEIELLKQIAQCANAILVLVSAYYSFKYGFLNIGVWISRITFAIRQNDIEWTHAYMQWALWSAILLTSIIIQLHFIF